jgi:hypothetical protein
MVQNRMKQQANQHQSERQFEEGDCVSFETTTNPHSSKRRLKN